MEVGHLPFLVSCLLLLAHSKAESKQLWRPRSTSVKDRQSSKGQSGRTSSLDSESSPDSWHSTQVRPGAISPDGDLTAESPDGPLVTAAHSWGTLLGLTLVGMLS